MDLLNRAKQLQDRTKKFAVRIIKAFAKLPKDEATRVLGDNSSDRELRWLRIIVRPVERDRAPTLFRRLLL